jgi:hypothetical protein
VGLPNQRSPANQPGRIVKSILAKSYLVSNATVRSAFRFPSFFICQQFYLG